MGSEAADLLWASLRDKGIRDAAVLDAIASVPRELFVPEELRGAAYDDTALPIGEGQTISQPYVVAATCQALEVRPGDKVLDVGTGSGYAAAVLCALGGEVYSIELLPGLLDRARNRLGQLGYRVHLRLGNGTFGWAEQAPFQRIAVGAGTPELPRALVDQLDLPGRLVLPLGDRLVQQLTVVDRHADGRVAARSLLDVKFVPLLSPPSA